MEIALIVVIVFLALALMWAYRRGFQEGYKIGNLKDKTEPKAVERVFEGPKKSHPKDKHQEAEERKQNILLANLGNYDGTDRGQVDVK